MSSSDGKAREDHPKLPRGLFIWVLVGFLVVLYFSLSRQEKRRSTQDLNSLFSLIESGNVGVIDIRGGKVRARTRAGEKLQFTIPPDYAGKLIDIIAERNESLPPSRQMLVYARGGEGGFMALMFTLVPTILLFVLIYFLFLRQVRAPSSLMSFGRSRAKLVGKQDNPVSFADVAGIDEAKEEVKELIEFLRNPAKFERLGGRVPRGVLLVGPPGTGKTLLARAIAGEAKRPFLSISGSDFVEMFVGVGAARVRDLFNRAKQLAPCIVFLDEIDAVGRRRGSGLGGGHDEREQTLNQILVELDGFTTNDKVVVIAATNRPDVLDPALLRPGRFDRTVTLDLPDVNGREAILRVHCRKKTVSPDVDLRVVARSTPYFSGADLENLLNESAILASLRGKDAIDAHDIEDAREKVQWGRAKRSKVIAEEERRIIAYHESGHALIAKLLPEVEPLHKVTIIPRGSMLGATMSIPERDRYLISRKRVLGDITLALAGRCAEEIFCNDVTSGAHNDLQRATELARLMICKWGMDPELGPIFYSENEEHLFLGRELTRIQAMSEETLEKIDHEIRKVINTCYRRAKRILLENREAIEEMARRLLAEETIDAETVDEIYRRMRSKESSGEQEPDATSATT